MNVIRKLREKYIKQYLLNYDRLDELKELDKYAPAAGDDEVDKFYKAYNLG